MLQIYLCGNNSEAKQAVAAVATKLGLSVLDRGSLSAATELENAPLELFPEWRLPIRLAVGLTAAFYLYLVIRDVVFSYVEKNQDRSFRLIVSLANKVYPYSRSTGTVRVFPVLIFCSFALPPGVPHRVHHHAVFVLLAWNHCSVLPALQGNQIQVRNQSSIFLSFIMLKILLVCGNNENMFGSRRFPNWLDRWMLCRKQLGLIALGLASLHVLYTLIIPLRYGATNERQHS